MFYEQLLELSKVRVEGVEKTPSQIILHCYQDHSTGICPHCQQSTTQIHQYSHRQVRDLNILNREVWLHIRVKNYVCLGCNRYFTEDFDWVEPNKSYTKRQAKWIFLNCSKQPFTEVGALLNYHSKTVERIYYEEGRKVLNLRERYAKVSRLGIDEIAHRKGKSDYCCVLTDLDTNEQLDILPNRKKETIIAHFQALGQEFCQQIKAVSCDIWEPYILACQACFPNASITIDRFHVVKALNHTLDTYRKTLRKKHPQQEFFKDIKWVLFKSKIDLQQQQKLDDAFKKAPLLEELVTLRNQFNNLFDMAPNALWLNQQLDIWHKESSQLALPAIGKFLKTLKNWQILIANFAENKLTNAATEGLNNLIRYVKRISFGIPNFEHMRLRVLLNFT